VPEICRKTSIGLTAALQIERRTKTERKQKISKKGRKKLKMNWNKNRKKFNREEEAYLGNESHPLNNSSLQSCRVQSGVMQRLF
jgi:hypothetical protein